MKPITAADRATAIIDRIRLLAIAREAQGCPLQYKQLDAILDGTLAPSTVDIACIAEESGVTVEFLLGIRGLARIKRGLKGRFRRGYWWWQGIGRHR